MWYGTNCPGLAAGTTCAVNHFEKGNHRIQKNKSIEADSAWACSKDRTVIIGMKCFYLTEHFKNVVLGLTVESTVAATESVVQEFPLSNARKERSLGSPLSIDDPDDVSQS